MGDELSPNQVADLVLNGECAGGTFLSKLPRFDATMQPVSTDWSELPNPLQGCEDSDGVCISIGNVLALDDVQQQEFDDGTLDFVSFLQDSLSGGEQSGWLGVIQNYALYSGLNAALAVLCFLFLFFYILIKCLCCCKRCLCRKKKKTASEPKRTKMSVMCQIMGILSLLFFIFFIFSFVLLGHTRGNKGFTETQKIMAAGVPVGAAEFVSKIPPLVSKALNDMGGSTFVTILERLNTTITTTVDFQVVDSAVVCIEDTLDSLNMDTINLFFGIIATVNASMQVLPDQATAVGQIESLDTTLTAMDDQLTIMRTFFGDLRTDLEALDLVAITDALDELSTTLDDDLQPSLQALQSSLTQLSENIPSSSEISSATTALANFRDDPTDASADAAIIELDNLVGLLSNIPTGVHTQIQAVLDLFGVASTSLANLETVLVDSKAAIDALPLSADVNATVQPLVDLVTGIDLAGVRSTLNAFADVIANVPRGVGDTVRDLSSIGDNLPCILGLGSEIEQITTDIYNLSIDSADLLQGFNDTISSSIGEIESLATMFDDIDIMLDGLPNMSEFISIIDSTEETLDSSVANLEIGDEVTALDDSVGSIDLDDLISSVATVRDQLDPGIVISESELTELANLPGRRDTAVGLLGDAKTAINDWKTNMSPRAGVCTTDGSECGPGITAACTESECTYSDLKAAIDAAIDNLNDFQSQTSSLPDFTSINTSIDDALNSIANVPTFDSAVINDLGAAIDAALPTIDSSITTMEELQTELQSSRASLDLDSIKTDIEVAMTQLDAVAEDLDLYNQMLVDFSDLLDDLLNGSLGAQIDSIVNGVKGLKNFLFVFLGDKLSAIRGDKIKQEIDVNGIFSGATLLADTMDDIYLEIQFIMSNFSQDSLNTTDSLFKDSLEEYSDTFDVLDAASNGEDGMADGHLFYLVKVLSKIDGLLDDSIASNIRIFEAKRFDSETVLTVEGVIVPGEPILRNYSNNVLCLTNECLMNTIDLYNSKPQFEIPVAREQAWMALFGIPAIVLLFALLALGCTVCGRSCTSPLVLCSCILAPFLFLLVGVVGMPVLLIFNDVCDNLEPIITTSVSSVQPQLCETFGLNVSDIGQYCTLNVMDDVVVELDLGEIAKSLLSECSGRSNSNGGLAAEPIQQLWKYMNEQVPDILDFVMAIEPEDEMLLGSEAITLVDDLKSEAGRTTRVLLSDLSGVFGCEAIGNVYDSVVDPICCNLRTSLFWLIMPWVLIALSICICTVPIICCAGRKRHRVSKVFAKDF